MNINMPDDARQIINTLQNNGFEAYIVGGCVRDSILGKGPKDWDITTSATPVQTKSLFRRTIDTGIEHGTVTIMLGKVGYEVTTYRVDGKYSDHRRPNEVTFTASLTEDLKRRDFTINAMAYNDKEGLIDMFDGMGDLDRRIIRCVGNPMDRFDEDALRILRAIRFAAQLDFDIDESTIDAIKNKCCFLSDISAERIQVELTKLITSNHPEKLMIAYELGVTHIVLPEFDEACNTPQNNPHHKYNVGQHTIEVMKHVDSTTVLRWAALLHDIGKSRTKSTDEKGIDHFYAHPDVGADIAKSILRRLKFDNNTINRVTRLVKWHDYGMDVPSQASFRKTLSEMGEDLFPDYLVVKMADIYGQSDYKFNNKIEVIGFIESMYKGIMERGECLSIKDLDIDGKNLIDMGIKPGPNMKIILGELLDDVLDTPSHNNNEYLSKKALKIYSTLN